MRRLRTSSYTSPQLERISPDALDALDAKRRTTNTVKIFCNISHVMTKPP